MNKDVELAIESGKEIGGRLARVERTLNLESTMINEFRNEINKIIEDLKELPENVEEGVGQKKALDLETALDECCEKLITKLVVGNPKEIIQQIVDINQMLLKAMITYEEFVNTALNLGECEIHVDGYTIYTDPAKEQVTIKDHQDHILALLDKVEGNMIHITTFESIPSGYVSAVVADDLIQDPDIRNVAAMFLNKGE